MSTPTILVIDNGLFVSMAERLARDVPVVYFSTWGNAFPVSREMVPGTGIENVTRVNEPIREMSHGRIVAVPDLYLNDLEYHARISQIPTFGAGEGNQLETDRWFLKEFLTEHDLPVIQSTEIIGTDDLQSFLMSTKDKFIKVSVFRGDMETFHHVDWHASQTWFEDLMRRLGPLGPQLRFIAEDPIPDALEVGLDGFFMGPHFVSPFVVGYEIKDAGYVGVVAHEYPDIVVETMDAIAGYSEENDYRCWFSNEMRITKDGQVFMTDATCRMPSPPGDVMLEAIQNFTDVVIGMAHGETPDPSFGDTRYLAEIVLKSGWAAEHWLEVRTPSDYAQFVKLNNYCRIDGHTWAIPHDSKYTEFGSAIGYGKTLEAACDMAKKVAESVKAYQLTFDANVLEQAQEQMERGSRLGLPK